MSTNIKILGENYFDLDEKHKVAFIFKKQKKFPLIIWLDTNIIIGINKAVNEAGDDKYVDFYHTIKNLVDEGKVACPLVRQRHEYERYGNPASVELNDKIILELSGGWVTTMVDQSIIEAQRDRMIKHFFSKKKEITYSLDLQDIFPHGKKELVHVLFSDSRTDKEREYTRQDLQRRYSEVKKLKLTENQIFLSEATAEATYYTTSIAETIRNYLNNYPRPNALGVQSLQHCHNKLYGEFEKYNNNDDDAKQLVSEYFNSQYHLETPINYVQSKLLGSIFSGSQTPQPTDVQDVESLSIILPYAHIIIPDNKMRGHIHRLGLPEKYSTKVYSADNLEKAVKYIKEEASKL
jgi:hypothetical protein